MEIDERYPALRGRTSAHVDEHGDRVRRELWRAYQAGKLSEDEFASTLDRLDCGEGGEQPQRDDRCEHCQLLGIHALQAEQAVAHLPPARIWRHTKCQHVLMWRGGGANVVLSEPGQRSYALT